MTAALIRLRVVAALALLLGSVLLLPACQSSYYRVMESFGQHKRDLLVSRVQDARDDQEAAKEQFRDALDAFTEVVGFEGGELSSAYRRLNSELERCEGKADRVRDRIESIEDVAGDLFREWEKELEQYASDDLRRRSQDQLDQTRRRYQQLLVVMQRAESKMAPVLTAFQDQVLFLKHNLNAQAVASLEGTAATIESDVADLIREMEAAIAEANEFIETMSA